MPNWSYNKIALQGTEKPMHEFIKLGLKNSGIEPTNDIEKDFALLMENAKTKAIDTDGEGGVKIVMENNLTARTFLPMPDTFLLHDTTNYPNKYPIEVVKEQEEKYGAVGWYDYNILTLGTKWNFKLNEYNEVKMEKIGDKYRIVFECETAWSVPTNWCKKIKSMFPDLGVFVSAHEEANAYCECGALNEDGTFDIYSDYLEDIQNGYNEYEDQRESCKKDILNDKERMDNITKKVKERIEGGEQASESELIEDELETMADDICGDFYDESYLYDELEMDFYKMLDENI